MALLKNAQSTVSTIPVITIDGPSGSGKGTIAQKLAAHMGWHWLDSGLLYRAVGFAVNEIFPQALDNPSQYETKIVEVLKDALEIHSIEGQGTQLYCLKKIIAPEILKSESIGRAASQLAVLPTVRHWLLQAQRIQRRAPGLVADGRDMGTVLFPDAQLKIYLTASVEERAQRRENQLKAMGINA
ncbi:MAG: (d)CMP kinase, partial [Pseudomonadota bacterium]